jgi:hypothetical protein
VNEQTVVGIAIKFNVGVLVNNRQLEEWCA